MPRSGVADPGYGSDRFCSRLCEAGLVGFVAGLRDCDPTTEKRLTMNRRFVRKLAAAVLMLAAGGTVTAADPAEDKGPVSDKAIVDALRDVHNFGADLYNQSKDYVGAFRVYEGALKTVRPLLSHRPAVQKVIDDGYAAATKEVDPARRAFLLHETIEKVRADLKAGARRPEEAKKPDDKKKVDDKKKPDPVKKPEEKKNATDVPMPKPKGTASPAPEGGAASASGTITFQGKPLAEGAVLFVSLDQKSPKVVVSKIKDGGYTAKDLVPGKYVVAVESAKDGKSLVPTKYATTDTSGLTVTVKGGTNTVNFDLR